MSKYCVRYSWVRSAVNLEDPIVVVDAGERVDQLRLGEQVLGVMPVLDGHAVQVVEGDGGESSDALVDGWMGRLGGALWRLPRDESSKLGGRCEDGGHFATTVIVAAPAGAKLEASYTPAASAPLAVPPMNTL